MNAFFEPDVYALCKKRKKFFNFFSTRLVSGLVRRVAIDVPSPPHSSVKTFGIIQPTGPLRSGHDSYSKAPCRIQERSTLFYFHYPSPAVMVRDDAFQLCTSHTESLTVKHTTKTTTWNSLPESLSLTQYTRALKSADKNSLQLSVSKGFTRYTFRIPKPKKSPLNNDEQKR
jgi:hypothetical protein